VADRILLVEDDPRLAEMVKTYLGGAGFQVTVAADGAAGLALTSPASAQRSRMTQETRAE
jgi:DNA-binding response OmpR family regulator